MKPGDLFWDPCDDGEEYNFGLVISYLPDECFMIMWFGSATPKQMEYDLKNFDICDYRWLRPMESQRV